MADTRATNGARGVGDDRSPIDQVSRIVIDPTGRILELNQTAQETLPELPGQGLGHPLLSRLPGWLGRLHDQGALTEDVTAGDRHYRVHMVWDREARRFIFTIAAR